MSPLESTGTPLFFRVADPQQAGLAAPPKRRGVALRTVARSLSVMQKEALISSSLTGVSWRLASDEGAYLMGDDAAPCPLAFMTTGMVACFMETLLARARQHAIPLPNLRLVQDNYYTMHGSALRGTMIGGALPVELTVEVDGPAYSQTLQDLVEDAIAAAPVHGLLRGVLPSLFTLSRNGQVISTGKVAALGQTAESIPAGCFENVQPDQGDWTSVIVRNGMSPKTNEVTSSTGSSYAEEQARRLHVRGIATLRPDGLKAIEQQLFNPHGSIFHFLSEESADRAPDALTYVSAGIAFCFMTQFGRYAKIVKKDLHRYEVIQKTFFSPDGLGSADPVETHVHLETSENDDFARSCLDMSEQTCFLHALCRSELKVNVRIGQGRWVAV